MAFLDLPGETPRSYPEQFNLRSKLHSLKVFSKLNQSKVMSELSLEIVNPHSAGIDVGSRFHMVAVGQGAQDVKKFGVFTQDHQILIEWLKIQGIRRVAMESTGSYWQTLFDSLQQAGFEVILVNGSHVKNVKGKKTDVLDCMWIQKLHSLGLLNASFLPQAELQKLRTYYNHRQHLVHQTARYINKMQKALRLMNIRLEIVINDIMGTSGRAIIEAIIKGERDPVNLSLLANYRVRKPKAEIAKSLEGNWREDLLFELQECLDLYDLYCSKIKKCDQVLETKINDLAIQQSPVGSDHKEVKVKQVSKFSPSFNIREMATRYFGVDLCEIGGVSNNTVLCLLTNLGNDIHRFPTAKHFCSWLRLSPNNKVSGGKVLSSRTPKGKNRIALAIRQAANSVGNQKNHPMGAFFKRIAFKKGREAAVTATARKLSVIFFNMITRKQRYQPYINDDKEQVVKTKLIKKLKQKLWKMNLGKEELKRMFETLTLSAT